MIYGYIRVSTERQDYNNQKHGILEYANKNGLGQIEFIEETISSRKKYTDRDLSNLVDRLKPNDILIVSELSRIGRSLMEVMSIFASLTEKKITTHIVKGQWVIGDPKDDIYSSVLIFAFGLAGQIERDLISQRTKEALALRKAQGYTLGRKKGAIIKSKLDGSETHIIELLKKRVSVASIAKIHSVARTTMVNFIRSRKLMEEVNDVSDTKDK